MAIRTANVALCDLGLNASPRRPVMRKQSYAFNLRKTVLMVELKDAGVAHTAIDARTIRKQSPEPPHKAPPALSEHTGVPRDVGIAIQAVMSPPIYAEALRAH